MSDSKSTEGLHKKIDLIFEDLAFGHNFEYGGKAIKELFDQEISAARIDENRRWQKLVLDRQALHSSSPYINALEYEHRIEALNNHPKKILGMDVKVDPRVPGDGIRFDHPDGRSEGFTLNNQSKESRDESLPS